MPEPVSFAGMPDHAKQVWSKWLFDAAYPRSILLWEDGKPRHVLFASHQMSKAYFARLHDLSVRFARWQYHASIRDGQNKHEETMATLLFAVLFAVFAYFFPGPPP